MRRQVFIFAEAGRDDAAKSARNWVTQLAKETGELNDRLTIEARKKEMQAIAQTIAQYGANFENAVKLRQARTKLVDEQLNVQGSAARRNLSDVIKSAMAMVISRPPRWPASPRKG